MSEDAHEVVEVAEAIPERPQPLEEEPFQSRAQNQWLKLRSLWAWGIFVWLSLEVLVSLRVLFLLGYRRMHLSPWTADGFFVTEFGQIVGLAALVIKNLFPSQ